MVCVYITFSPQYVDEAVISLNVKHVDHSASDGKVKGSVALVFE